jgi:hypothetical protein
MEIESGEDIWQAIYRFAVSHFPDTIETTLLGGVPYSLDTDGTTISRIPEWLKDKASRHGMAIVSADCKRDVYTLKLK